VFDRVTKAVFPVAGMGTRFLPATKAQPKEMLCVVDKPLIQYAVEEAYEAGIRHMVFVTGRNKRAIEDHFDSMPELERELENSGKLCLLEAVRGVQPADMVCTYVRQPKALGLGHAVLCARPIVGAEPFAVLLADDLMVGKETGRGITRQLVDEFVAQQASVIAVQDVPREQTKSYGIVDVGGIMSSLAALRAIVEKPAPQDAPSTLGVAGRYVLSPKIFDLLAQQGAGAGGEIQLTDAIAKLVAIERVFALRYEGQRFDCGSKIGFLAATMSLAATHPEVGAEFRALMAK
jgi:UTP--glucose-1-phosphate uridylyltransferase